MAKTVNASVVVTRDGSTTVQNFPGMGYATFVALQSSLSGVLSMLQSWGSIRVAELIEGRAGEGPGGDCDLNRHFRQGRRRDHRSADAGRRGGSACSQQEGVISSSFWLLAPGLLWVGGAVAVLVALAVIANLYSDDD